VVLTYPTLSTTIPLYNLLIDHIEDGKNNILIDYNEIYNNCPLREVSQWNRKFFKGKSSGFSFEVQPIPMDRGL